MPNSTGEFVDFCMAFTTSVVAWNNVESAARSILVSLTKASQGAEAAFIHLGNVALKDAVLTVLDLMVGRNAPASKEVDSHVRHFIDGMDIIRGYRNFYVHSLIAIGVGEGASVRGLLFTQEAKGRFAWIQQEVSVEEMGKFLEHMLKLEKYASSLDCYLRGFRDRGEARTGEMMPLASLEKPTWPQRLSKNRDYL